jgi:hypothetical protein
MMIIDTVIFLALRSEKLHIIGMYYPKKNIQVTKISRARYLISIESGYVRTSILQFMSLLLQLATNYLATLKPLRVTRIGIS